MSDRRWRGGGSGGLDCVTRDCDGIRLSVRCQWKKPVLLVLFVSLVSCEHKGEREGTDRANGRVVAKPAQPVIGNNRGLLFTYFDFRAELKTVDTIQQVPQEVRGDVMVTDPTRRLSGDRVYVADLSRQIVGANKEATYKTRVEKKGSWLARVMPKTSRLNTSVALAARPPATVEGSQRNSSRRSAAKRSHKKPRRKVRSKRGTEKTPAIVATAAPKQTLPQLPSANTTVPAQSKRSTAVVLFGTAWCGSCKSARRYFLSRNIPFRDLDVERDAEGGQYYAAVVKRAGLRPGVVPVILIGSRVLQGFSPLQVGSALAQLAAKPGG